MDTIAIYTQAHNAEKTLARTIDSVLGQTYKNFVYYIGDNCSTDSTRQIILEYAAKDDRIVPILYDGDGTVPEHIVANLLSSYHTIAGNEAIDYFCNLDADDVYHEDFFEAILDFLKKNDLDMAAAGFNFVDAVSNKTTGTRSMEQDLIISGQGFGKYLPYYHCFMRTVWAKLYKIECFRKMLAAGLPTVAYGLDTIVVFDTLKWCHRAGILHGRYHDYYISPKSSSYSWLPDREQADAVINSHVISFLKEKVGYVSEQNRSFLDTVYINGIKDTVMVLIKCNNSISDKLSVLRNIVSNEYTIAAMTNANLKSDLTQLLLDLVCSFPESKTNPDGIWLGLTLSSLVEDQDRYIEFSLCNMVCLLDNNCIDEAETELREWESILPDNDMLKKLRQRLNS